MSWQKTFYDSCCCKSSLGVRSLLSPGHSGNWHHNFLLSFGVFYFRKVVNILWSNFSRSKMTLKWKNWPRVRLSDFRNISNVVGWNVSYLTQPFLRLSHKYHFSNLRVFLELSISYNQISAVSVIFLFTGDWWLLLSRDSHSGVFNSAHSGQKMALRAIYAVIC